MAIGPMQAVTSNYMYNKSLLYNSLSGANSTLPQAPWSHAGMNEHPPRKDRRARKGSHRGKTEAPQGMKEHPTPTAGHEQASMGKVQ